MSEITLTPVVTRGFFLDGKWVEQGDPVDVRSPYDGTVIARVFQGRREQAEGAVAAALARHGIDGASVAPAGPPAS